MAPSYSGQQDIYTDLQAVLAAAMNAAAQPGVQVEVSLAIWRESARAVNDIYFSPSRCLIPECYQERTSSEMLFSLVLPPRSPLQVQRRPAEFKATVKLTRPAVRDAAGFIANLMRDEDFDSILYKTLPAGLANERFLNALSPFCYRELVQAAMGLVFGLEWKKRLPQPPVKGGMK